MKTTIIAVIAALAFAGCGTTGQPPTPQQQALITAAEQIALSYLSAYAAKGGNANQSQYVNMAIGAILAAYPTLTPAQAQQVATTTFK